MSAARALLSLLALVLAPLLAVLLVLSAVAPGGLPGALALLLLAALLGRRAAARARPAAPRGVELLRGDHPRLWAEVDGLAGALAVERPQRVLVVASASITVTTAGERRELHVGLPLLAATSRAQLRALLGRELAREELTRTGAAGLSCRARQAVLTALGHAPAPALLLRLARPCLHVAALAAHDLEQAADARAAQAVGSQPVASGLRRALEVGLAWDVLHRAYVPMAATAQLRPALVHGLHHVLGARAEAIEQAVAARLAQPPAALDPHPVTAARLAALVAVPVLVPSDEDDEKGACTLLDGGFRRLELLETALHPSSLPPAPWDELVAAAGAAACAERTAALARVAPAAGVPAPVTLAGLLEAVGRGAGTRLVAPLLPPAAAPPDRAAEEDRLLVQHLAAALAHSLCHSGEYVHRVDWTGPARLTHVEHPEQVVDVEGLIRHVLADVGQVPELIRQLAARGAALTSGLERVAAGATVLEGLATCLMGPDRRRYDLLACSTGVLILPAHRPAPWQLDVRSLSAGVEQLRQRRVATLLTADLTALRAEPGARWIGTQEVLAGRVERGGSGWRLQVRVRLGLPLELRSTRQTHVHGTPLDAVLAVLAERAGEQAWQASTLGVQVHALTA